MVERHNIGEKGGGTVSFDIPPMHIDDNTPEARIIEAIVSRDHVSPEEVVRRALRGMVMDRADTVSKNGVTSKNPGELLFGLFADDPGLIRKIATDARSARDQETVTDRGA